MNHSNGMIHSECIQENMYNFHSVLMSNSFSPAIEWKQLKIYFEWQLASNVCCNNFNGRTKQVFDEHVLRPKWIPLKICVFVFELFSFWVENGCLCWIVMPLLLLYSLSSCSYWCFLAVAHVFVVRFFVALLWRASCMKSTKPEYGVFSTTLYSDAFSSQYLYVRALALLGVSTNRILISKYYKWK